MRYINIDNVLTKNPDLCIEKNDDHTPRRVHGIFIMNSSYNDVCFCNEYSISIDLKSIPPQVTETRGAVPKDYPHRYMNGKLCLEATPRIMIECTHNNDFDFECWFNGFLTPYFFTLEYYKRFGDYPFGERSHGITGILEYYKEYFNLTSIQQTRAFLKQVSKMKRYRGHLLCPCGSKKRIRNCHRDEVITALQPIQKESIVETVKEMVK